MTRRLASVYGGLLLAFSCAACSDRDPTADADESSSVLTVAETPTRARAADGRYLSWREHRIDDQELAGGVALRGADGLELADFDRDGREDLVSVHEDSGHVRLSFGSGDPSVWPSATLAEGEEAAAAEDPTVGDLNGDGWPDIVVACEREHLIYFQNPGNPDAVRSGNWPRLILPPTRGRGSWIRVFAADLDGDGQLELSAPNKGDEQYAGQMSSDPYPPRAISIFDFEGDPLDAEAWRETVLIEVEVPINAEPVDFDGDGDLDLLGGSRGEARIFWLENLLEEATGELRFVERPIEVTGRNAPQERGPKRLTGMNVQFADLDGDGRLDVVLQETPFLNVWLRQPESLDQPWPIHRIGDLGPDSPTGLLLADLDGDGDLDLFTGGYSADPRDRDGDDVTASSRVGRLAWFENPGSARLADPERANDDWIRHDVSRRVRGMFDMFFARDLDGDGDLDLLATRGNSGAYDGVFWLEQIRSDDPRPAFEPARAEESRHLPLPPE